MMKTALIDASSAILLYKAQIFDSVASAYRLLVAASAYREITVAGRAGAADFRHFFPDHRILGSGPPPDELQDMKPSTMGPGERDTVAAYGRGGADFIIIDDGKGARACRVQAIPYINALLCPKILYFAGRIEALRYQRAFDRLKRMGRYSSQVLDFAQSCTSDMLADFFPTPCPRPEKGLYSN